MTENAGKTAGCSVQADRQVFGVVGEGIVLNLRGLDLQRHFVADPVGLVAEGAGHQTTKLEISDDEREWP